MNEREQLAKDNGMTIEFVNWFFDNKKEGCGNVWFMMMAAMWEGWSGRESKCAALAADNEKAMEAMRQADAAVKLAHEKFSALAAENAELKKAAEFATAPDMWIEQADGMLDYRYCERYVDVLKAAMETPATDAFLAEVRASAIEHAASERWGSGYVFDELNDFAAQLRKGVQS